MTEIDSEKLLACAVDDEAIARHLLEEAAERLDEQSGAMSVAEFAQASAAVATGYAHLATIGLNMATAAGAAEQNARILEMQSVVADAHRAMEARQRAEQAEIEARTAKLAELDAATLAASGLREERAVAEARPHDDEPDAQPFLGFTEHGHSVGGPVPNDAQAPRLVAKCGGPMVCGERMDDAGDLRRAAREAKPPHPAVQAATDFRKAFEASQAVDRG